MKKWLFFLGGVLTGIVFTIVALFVISYVLDAKSDSIDKEVKNDDGITLFEKPGDVMEESAFEVFQVLTQDAALVRAQAAGEPNMFMGKICLIMNKDGNYYYDDQIIKATEGKVFRQVGIYRYETRSESLKTVPIVMLMDK